MNAFQLYRFLLHGPTKEVRSFLADYDLHLSKTEVKQLQQLFAEISLFDLRFPLSKEITDDIKAIIGDQKWKKLQKLLQQYV